MISSMVWTTNKDGSRTGNQTHQQVRPWKWLLSSESPKMARSNRSRSRLTTLHAVSYPSCSMLAVVDPEEQVQLLAKLLEPVQGESQPSLRLVGQLELLERISSNSWSDQVTPKRVSEAPRLQSPGFSPKDSKRFSKERSQLKDWKCLIKRTYFTKSLLRHSRIKMKSSKGPRILFQRKRLQKLNWINRLNSILVLT